MMQDAVLAMNWSILAIVLPLAAGLLTFCVPRLAALVGLAAGLGVVAAVAGLMTQVAAAGPVRTTIGGWGAPLGVDLHADGLALVMLAMTALVGLLVGTSAAITDGWRHGPSEEPGRAHRRRFFWPLWLLLQSGMNALYLSADVFNLYITLEIVGLAAVGLAVLVGTPAALKAGLTYLVVSLLGSFLFLLGVDYLYAALGRMDIAGLSATAQPSPAASAAFVLMLAGLALKAALFPLHFWLPAAHANAAPAASALLSALVVKTSLYVMLRLWFDVFAPLVSGAIPIMLGLLGTGAIVWGSIQAFRAERLKLLVAYSTVAQLGYVALALALTGTDGMAAAWAGAVYIMLAHAAAKAAMFLACGRIAQVLGHDRIADLDRAALRPSLAQFSFALASVSLIGLPPSGGFIAKWLITEGALEAGAWHWAGIVVLGTILTAGYFARVLAAFLRGGGAGYAMPDQSIPVRSIADGPPLALALAAVALGLAAAGPLDLLAIGSPFTKGDLL